MKHLIAPLPNKCVLTEVGATRDVTDFVISAAAAGYAREAAKVISESEAAETLESLEVGLRIFLGETPRIALEIFEVGQDVAQRIRDRQQARVGGDGSSSSGE